MKKMLLFVLLVTGMITVKAQLEGLGTPRRPYKITNHIDLDYFMRNYMGDNGVNKYFVLTDDIHMGDHIRLNYSSSTGWVPVNDYTYFKGHLDGDGHIIHGIWKKQSGMTGGLFSALEGGSITNLGLILGEKGVDGKYYAGGLVGVNRGVIEGCFVYGKVFSSQPQGLGIGLLAGANGSLGSIYDCWTGGQVSAAVIVEPMDGGPGVSGFVGMNEGTVMYCYTSAKNLTTINITLGGFIGYNKSTGISKYNFFDSQEWGSAVKFGRDDNLQSAYTFAKTKTQLRTRSTFTNWDFTNMWVISGGTMPYLWWQEESGMIILSSPVQNNTLELSSTGLNIYPNPATGFVTVETPVETPSVQVYDANGNMIINTTEKTVNLSSYPTGTYIFNVGGEVKKVYKK